MLITKEHSLFTVSVSDSNAPKSSWTGVSKTREIIVVAKDIHEASMKALQFIDLENEKPGSVINSDGDLVKEPSVISITTISSVKAELIY